MCLMLECMMAALVCCSRIKPTAVERCPTGDIFVCEEADAAATAHRGRHARPDRDFYMVQPPTMCLGCLPHA